MMLRNKSYQGESRKKISLPAALFNRSPAKGSQNSSMISNRQKNKDYHCYNHPGKKGKYLVVTEQDEDDQEIYYCEKCAILLASRGFQVKKLEQEQSKYLSTVKKSKNSRQAQLQQFLQTLNAKVEVLNKAQQQGKNLLQNWEEKEEREVSEIQQFFEEIAALLEKRKNSLLHSLMMNNKSQEQELRDDLTYVNEKIETLEIMQEDITTSLNSIVRDTPEEDYQLVMSHYKGNLKQIKTEFDSLRQNNIQLPSSNKIENVLNELFIDNQTPAIFSFDSSRHTLQ